jgi:hypothetical protein
MGIATFSANANYYIDVDAALVSQNQAGNYSTIYWRVDVVKTYGYGFQATTNTGNSGWANSSVGSLWGDNNLAYNFANGQMSGRWTIASGTFNVAHRSDGNAEYWVSGGLTLVNLGTASAGTGTRSLPRIQTSTVPPAPTGLGVDSATQTSLHYWFVNNGDGGAPILEWQIGWDPVGNYATSFMDSGGSSVITGLLPGQTYYIWSRGRNANGWGPWSNRLSARTIAGARINSGGTWHEAIPYVNVNGVWKLAQPYVNSGGTWKKGI